MKTEVSNQDHIYLRAIREFTRHEVEKVARHEKFSMDKIHILIEDGRIHQIITQKAEELGMDLIIMGTQGTYPLESMFVGSNAEKVVRLAPCPVLTIRDQRENFILAKILFATDLQSVPEAAMAFIRELLRIFEGELHLVFVNSVFGLFSEEEIERKKEHFVLAAKLDHYQFHSLSARNEEAGILLTAQKINADIIALATHQRQGLAHFFLGSAAEDVVNHSFHPVLTFGAKMEKNAGKSSEE